MIIYMLINRVRINEVVFDLLRPESLFKMLPHIEVFKGPAPLK